MKSLHQSFDDFLKEFYPGVGPAAVLAMRRAFFHGYASHAEHFLNLMESNEPAEAIGKIHALLLSSKSFLHDCD